MTARQYPNCGFQVFPGVVACHRCKYDFILGRMPDAGSSEKFSRNQAAVLAIALAALVGILFALLGGEKAEVVADAHPCELRLAELVPLVQGARKRGNAIPSCEATPPEDRSCWLPAGVPQSSLDSEVGLSFTLTPTATGFQVECFQDADGDGVPAVYRANPSVAAVRLSDASIR